MPSEPVLKQYRVRPDAGAAMVFVHGFSGQPEKTWGRFLDLAGSEPG
jgi:hypothetical protein